MLIVTRNENVLSEQTLMHLAPCIIFSCDRWIVSISSPCLFLCTSFHILWAWARYFFVMLVEIGPATVFKSLWIDTTTTTRWHKKPKASTHLLEATTGLLDSNTPTILRLNVFGMMFKHALSTNYARLEWCNTDGFPPWSMPKLFIGVCNTRFGQFAASTLRSSRD